MSITDSPKPEVLMRHNGTSGSPPSLIIPPRSGFSRLMYYQSCRMVQNPGKSRSLFALFMMSFKEGVSGEFSKSSGKTLCPIQHSTAKQARPQYQHRSSAKDGAGLVMFIGWMKQPFLRLQCDRHRSDVEKEVDQKRHGDDQLKRR
ncbi:hypothetical protein DPMN_063698 [Dreissena polymorpha]|uniref:Uncharacterized protein n=1 Tax=Dreissena polymorpha TaxID=45954 RepID=A0A9D4CC86_DREPO|nr:hypothetical protein DPMN_063698 [Dreissena polymorpha]